MKNNNLIKSGTARGKLTRRFWQLSLDSSLALIAKCCSVSVYDVVCICETTAKRKEKKNERH
jgi:hypothetical protein